MPNFNPNFYVGAIQYFSLNWKLDFHLWTKALFKALLLSTLFWVLFFAMHM